MPHKYRHADRKIASPVTPQHEPMEHPDTRVGKPDIGQMMTPSVLRRSEDSDDRYIRMQARTVVQHPLLGPRSVCRADALVGNGPLI